MASIKGQGRKGFQQGCRESADGCGTIERMGRLRVTTHPKITQRDPAQMRRQGLPNPVDVHDAGSGHRMIRRMLNNQAHSASDKPWLQRQPCTSRAFDFHPNGFWTIPGVSFRGRTDHAGCVPSGQSAWLITGRRPIRARCLGPWTQTSHAHREHGVHGPRRRRRT